MKSAEVSATAEDRNAVRRSVGSGTRLSASSYARKPRLTIVSYSASTQSAEAAPPIRRHSSNAP